MLGADGRAPEVYEDLPEETPLIGSKKSTIEGLEEIGGFCGGLIDDYRRRSRFLYSDWIADAFTWKTLSAAFFMFFATFTSTLALAEHIQETTNGLIGMNEYFIMNSAAGMFHAVFGCQPLLILRPTGPVTLFFEKLLNVATQFGLPFWPFFAWTGIFVSLFMFLISAFELCKHIKHLTLFTEDIFATFIGCVYINDGIHGMTTLWYTGPSYGSVSAASKLLTLNLTIGFTSLALWLSLLQSSKLLNFHVRVFLKDYALTITLFVSVFVGLWINGHLFPVDFISTNDSGFRTTADRSWRTNLLDISPAGVGIAALAAIPVVIFFYLDQNISSSLCQKPEMNLTKGSYYHSSFACMAFFSALGPLFGLPFVTGSLPHSPQFVVSLSETNQDGSLGTVRENRLAPLLSYFFIGLPLLLPSLLSSVPKAAVFGTLIFVGVTGIQSTSLYERALLLVTDAEFWPLKSKLVEAPLRMIVAYTLLQIGLVVACWECNVYIGIYFPLFVMALVPFRWCVLARIFSPEDLKILDAEVLDEEPTFTGTFTRTGSIFRQ